MNGEIMLSTGTDCFQLSIVNATIHSSHSQELFGYKIELNLVQYIMAILDYVSADILKVPR